MKVLHVIPSVSPVRGGPSQAVLEMVHALCEQEITAEIVTTNDHGLALLDVPLQEWIDYPLLTTEKNVRVCFFPRFSPQVGAVREFAFSGALTRWLWQHIADYDLVHVHAIFSYSSTIAMTIARHQKVPYIVRPIGQLCEWSLEQSARKKQIYLDLIERENLKHSRSLHLTSEQEQREVSRLGLNISSFVLPLGFSFSDPIPDARQRLRQQFNLLADEPVILFLSRLHPKKGLDYLIPALGKLIDHRFTFILAGSGDPNYEAQIELLLTSHSIQERTRLTGFVEGEAKNLLLQGADLFVLTSHSENFGIAVLEAMVSGLQVIVTPGVALAPMIEKHQLGLVPQLEVSQISQAIEQFLNDLGNEQKLQNYARQFILNHYSWERVADNLIKIYENVLTQDVPLKLGQ